MIRAAAQTRPEITAASQRRCVQVRRRALRPPVRTFTLPSIPETESPHREAWTRTRIRRVRGLTGQASPQCPRFPLQPRRSEHRLVRIPPPRPQGQTITPLPSARNAWFNVVAASSSVPGASQRGHRAGAVARGAHALPEGRSPFAGRRDTPLGELRNVSRHELVGWLRPDHPVMVSLSVSPAAGRRGDIECPQRPKPPPSPALCFQTAPPRNPAVGEAPTRVDGQGHARTSSFVRLTRRCCEQRARFRVALLRCGPLQPRHS